MNVCFYLTSYMFNMSPFVLTRLQLKNLTTNADIIIFTSFFLLNLMTFCTFDCDMRIIVLA